MTAPPPAASLSRQRDDRIDLARGLTMLIIFVVHVPANAWAEFIPAKFGFSSGAEAFVLCSGLACGLAFGGTFRRQGWAAGTRRIARRVAQLWGAQVLGFAAFCAMLLAVDAALGGGTYRERYGLSFVAAAPFEAFAALATLRYVPDFFDILPLYIVVLAATPLFVALARVSAWLALAASAALWLLVQLHPLNLPAHPAGAKLWYFDPLAWQFLFFLGFAVTAGWLRVPDATRARKLAAGAVILACMPLTFWGAHQAFPPLQELYFAIYPNEAITTLHPLRLAHVLILAWLFAALLAPCRSRLRDTALKPIIVVGQQSLITFMTGVFLSALAGVALDLAGRSAVTVTAANLAGFGLLIAAAYLARSVKAGLKHSRIAKEPTSCPA
jgi:hypothetical protein